ncbi:iron dependent repressor DNA binding domain protein [Marvinbryantia formatexigens DSM 14469]|uniref:Manganese transport regulator n=1 Tax=Marvinbryantia formatexigens DSM 14469 TaxID=478749 RepID=C6LGU7_9FIRM|nr:metal-dependent transcriptional regulator [Marvinbryantia formatexigens]EET60297.1 iron dependent repressor DNA binding domain protein [Marvinbryantia formatexigens DSM 14469]UWO24312.1 metal-dependent transcriptional regulator [Marvinbryantia formatexigens DSM 14469]SDF54656.1 iron (metal) dependent repressor, DtxR family [Marvinbryantia formatexigens]
MKRATEDYLKTIYMLSKKGEVHGSYIAEKLGISRPTVSVYLRNLETEGYIRMDENRAVFLTEAGETIARDIYARHATLQQLLEELGVDSRTAAEDACRMEHAISPKSFEAIKKLMIQKGS